MDHLVGASVPRPRSHNSAGFTLQNYGSSTWEGRLDSHILSFHNANTFAWVSAQTQWFWFPEFHRWPGGYQMVPHLIPIDRLVLCHLCRHLEKWIEMGCIPPIQRGDIGMVYFGGRHGLPQLDESTESTDLVGFHTTGAMSSGHPLGHVAVCHSHFNIEGQEREIHMIKHPIALNPNCHMNAPFSWVFVAKEPSCSKATPKNEQPARSIKSLTSRWIS